MARCVRCDASGTVETLVREHVVCLLSDTLDQLSHTHRPRMMGRRLFCQRLAPCTQHAGGCRWAVSLRALLAGTGAVRTRTVEYLSGSLLEATTVRRMASVCPNHYRQLFGTKEPISEGLQAVVTHFVDRLRPEGMSLTRLSAWRLAAAYRCTSGHPLVRDLVREWFVEACVSARMSVLLRSKYLMLEALDGDDDWFVRWICSLHDNGSDEVFATVGELVVRMWRDHPASLRGYTLTMSETQILGRFMAKCLPTIVLLEVCDRKRVSTALTEAMLRAWGEGEGLRSDQYMETLRNAVSMSFDGTRLLLHWLRPGIFLTREECVEQRRERSPVVTGMRFDGTSTRFEHPVCADPAAHPQPTGQRLRDSQRFARGVRDG